MSVKSFVSQWKSVIACVAFCGAAFFLYERAWNVGYAADAMGLLGNNFLRLILLLLAWAALAMDFKAQVSKVKTRDPRATSTAGMVGGFLIFPGCMGCYPIWPAILLLLLAILFLAQFRPSFSEAGTETPAGNRLKGLDVLRMGIGILLFTLTWYLCASTTRQALLGLGERIGDKVGEEKMFDWARSVLAKHQGDDKKPFVEPDEIPDFIKDLMGRFQGVQSVGLGGWGAEPCVTIYTGTSAYSFRISICPSRISQGGPPWWFGDDGSEWRPGIFVGTQGK
jgi:hypothetical protein